ncbi:Proteasome subunit beta type [Spironucleus salmonicida]|uniref:Proteasome subunit beta n=1 Tax=Spironucleus salmonicida TaxID=348837 RepID=V6LVY5_9EUKA|nr:Proteasome subunit beta type [Spironucleus salmonicida]|eukprot:EST48408.1 Proteasome subunit beta type [Spironucleus salmonicida]
MSDASTYNGGAILAMKGKNCVVVATDKRLGASYQTITMNYPKISQPNKSCLLAIAGFASDAQMLHRDLASRCELFEFENNRSLTPSELINLVSAVLYEKRFGPLFVSPIIAGMEGDISIVGGHDSIGAPAISDWIVDGTANEFLLGPAQMYWKEGMGKEELIECASKVMQAGTNRDAYSGWGIQIHCMEADGSMEIRDIACRMD